VSLLKNVKEMVPVGEEEEDQNLNMSVRRVSLLKNGKEMVSVGEGRMIRTLTCWCAGCCR
jgi:hypothetical protein